MTQYAIVTDLNRCVGCLSCAVSCKAINGVPIGNYWTKILRIGPNPKSEGAVFPDVEYYYLPVQCQHCEDPECIKVCPTQASHKREDGTVQIDKSKCIGCQFCVMACPYGVRYLNEEERVVEKCTLCEQKTSNGELPQCVSQCVGLARYFGDLDATGDNWGDLKGGGNTTFEVSVQPYSKEQVYTLPNVGNEPSFRFILRDRKWQGGDR